MTYAEAKRIQYGDEVVIIKTQAIRLVIETEKRIKDKSAEEINFLLSDGKWYGYKEVS